MIEVQYFRGPRALYNLTAHGNGIYFATDTLEILHNGVAYLGNLPEEVAAITALAASNKSAIDTLNGNGEGSVRQQIDSAINDFASKISDDGTVNTFKELIDYVAENGGSIGNLIIELQEIKAKDEEQDNRLLVIESNIDEIQDILTWKTIN